MNPSTTCAVCLPRKWWPALRHADIGLTRDHYTDKKEAKVVDIKGLLAADESAGDAAAG